MKKKGQREEWVEAKSEWKAGEDFGEISGYTLPKLRGFWARANPAHLYPVLLGKSKDATKRM